MSFAKLYSAQTSLLRAHIIDIEVDLSRGLHSFSIVGLPDKAVEEARDRIGAAIKNAGFKSPKHSNQKVVIALAPADLKKEGPSYDVGMALAYLLAGDFIHFNPEKKIFLGELSLDGQVRGVSGVLALAQKAKEEGFEEMYVPEDNAKEAALVAGLKIFGVKNLKELTQHLDDGIENINRLEPTPKTKLPLHTPEFSIDFADVKGQEVTKRGLEIAAAGGHNIAMYGPPGTGKTMLAKAFVGILPTLSFDEALEVTSIHSIAGTLKSNIITHPPFRSPHHSSSYSAIVGGGMGLKPGEITLAHRGVLFMDEFPEFNRDVIEALRQPLEEREISISRVKGSARFPADFMLVAALNPCPCGNFGIKGKQCSCAPANLLRYQKKISGPIIDRIDMWTEVSSIDHSLLSDNTKQGDGTESVRERVTEARAVQRGRFARAGRDITKNSQMNTKDLATYAPLTTTLKDLLNKSATVLDLSPRAYHRVIKLARTIADLAQKENIEESHLMEALQYRNKK